MSTIKLLRVIADPTRIRILLLLEQQELSVAELQEILGMGQSRISSLLAQLKQAGFVSDHRSGKNSIYSLRRPKSLNSKTSLQLFELIRFSGREMEEVSQDKKALRRILQKREDNARNYFNQLAGKYTRAHCPGRTWKALAEALLKLMPPQVIVDMGAGEGTLAQLLAQKAKRVIAIDNSEKMVEYGQKLAKQHQFANLEYRLGDIQNPPVKTKTADLVIFSQALHHAHSPLKALQEAQRILKSQGKLVILDLLKHQFEEARQLYADVWLGFSEVEILDFLNEAGFHHIETNIVHKEKQKPHLQTLLAIAEKL